MSRFKGPAFPSFREANLGPQKPRMQWVAHCGKSAQLRNLRHVCRPIYNSRDPETMAAVARCRAAVANEPLPEFGELHLIAAALDACDQTGERWSTCMNYFMDKFDQKAADDAEAATRI